MTTIFTTPPENSLAVERLREQELEEARLIQSSMFPSQALHAGAVVVSHEFQPVTEVGGDYLDYFNLSDETLGLYIGDVSGKGLPAALYAALAVGTLRGVHKTGQQPGRVLALLNQRLSLRCIPGRHSALQYALFDPVTGEMRIASAGMPGPLLLREGECQILQIAGIPPGLFPNVSYEELSLRLRPGDTLLFCTDGLTDARDANGQEFGLEGLQEVCIRHAAAKPLDLLEQIFKAIQQFTRDCRQWDDMAAAVFHYTSQADETHVPREKRSDFSI